MLPILRYKAAGLRKRLEWEKTWELQREEDGLQARIGELGGQIAEKTAEHDGEVPRDDERVLELIRRDVHRLEDERRKFAATIPVPPKFTSADFLKGDCWRLRGKLDVPKERWISFPHCEGPDGTLMIAWAGYDHLQLAQAVSAYYVDVQERLGGRDDPRLIPLLACLIELLPWLKQWHNKPNPAFNGTRMGDYFDGFVAEEARQLGKTIPEIKAWAPPARIGGRGRRRAAT